MFYIELLQFIANFFLDPEVFWGLPILLAILYAVLKGFGPEKSDAESA